MTVKVPIDDAEITTWVEIAHGARLLQHCLQRSGEPRPGSSFAQVAELYPFEQVAERVKAYLTAAVEHLIFWADLQVPLKFHPEQAVEVTLRPSYTLARASIESASQAVWLMNTTDPVECIRRHVSLLRWDLQELRKSRLDAHGKDRARALEDDLLDRVSDVFTPEEVRPPGGYLEVIKFACSVESLHIPPGDAERIWRAASGVAHGKYWPTQELQKLVDLDQDGARQGTSIQVPDLDGITEVLHTAHKITQVGVLTFLGYLGADVGALIKAARNDLREVIPLKDGASRDDLRRLFSSEGEADVVE